MPEKIYFIRHGDTVYSGQCYIGFTDADLNEKGINNARKAVPFFIKNKPDAVFSSDLKRASRTAEILFPSVEILKNPLLRELNFGEWETLNYKEISAIDAEYYEKWLSSPADIAPPAGETLAELNTRIKKFIQQLKGRNIAIVSHTGPIILMLFHFLNKPLADFYDIIIPPASVSVLHLKHEKACYAEIDIFGSRRVIKWEK